MHCLPYLTVVCTSSFLSLNLWPFSSLCLSPNVSGSPSQLTQPPRFCPCRLCHSLEPPLFWKRSCGSGWALRQLTRSVVAHELRAARAVCFSLCFPHGAPSLA